MTKVLGIDQSYNNSGYCLVDNDTSTIIVFGTIQSDKTESTYQRALSIAIKICGLINTHAPSSINIEGLAFGIQGNATRDLAGLLFTIVNVVKLKYPTLTIQEHAPTALKKRATGSGSITKRCL
jgi:Holliday junction resolvasome RuvABC endonuclease subunit